MSAADAQPTARRSRPASSARTVQPTEPFLVWEGPDGRRQLLRLHAGLQRVRIGRGPSNHVALTWDTEVSRHHAELELLTGAWTITDDGLSRAGTWVNDEKLSGRRKLRDGDRIRLGGSVIAICIPGARRSRAKKPPAKGPQLTPTQAKILEALCRPYRETEFATPASNQAIAEELFLSADAVRAHLRALATGLGIEDGPAEQRRVALARRALQLGLAG